MTEQPVHRADLRIDVDALRTNVALLAERARRSGARTMVVVKSDGYGHGAATVARAALSAGASEPVSYTHLTLPTNREV